MGSYCPACGVEVTAKMRFCPECGEEFDDYSGTGQTEASVDEASGTDTSQAEVTGDDTDQIANQAGWRGYLPRSWQIGLAGLFMGCIAGGLVAWGLANIGGSAVGFLLGFIIVTGYLWQKPTGIGALGSGCYIAAILLAIVPLFFYGPIVGASDDPQTAEEFGTALGGIVGLFIWTVVFAVIAAVIGVVGYFMKKRQVSKLENK